MGYYRKKPVVVEAFKWTGDQTQIEDPLWIVEALKNRTAYFARYGGEIKMVLKTLEGDVTASYGDYIIKGIKGEIYPCKPDIFEATYDAVQRVGAGDGDTYVG